MEIAQTNKNLMIAAQELLVMMVTIEMTLVVVPPHLPHKEEVMSDLSLPSCPTNSHTASRMKNSTSRHCPEVAKPTDLSVFSVFTVPPSSSMSNFLDFHRFLPKFSKTYEIGFS
jgi:hypothetical protein